MPGKADEKALRAFLDGLEGAGGDGGGKVYHDLMGSAVYRLEPSWLTAILCPACRYIGLVLTIPRRRITWPCPRCERRQLLIPPDDVLNVPDPVGQNPRLAARRRLIS